MSQLKKISALALAIGIALTGACSTKPVETEIATNPDFYDVPLQENYFSYYYDYDMGKSVATGSYDKPANVTNVKGIKNIKYKFSIDENKTYLDLVFNYKTNKMDGKPYFVTSVNDTDGKVLTMNEKNRKVETCRTVGTIGEVFGVKPGCWITEKVQVVFPTFPNDAPVSVIVNFMHHQPIGIDLSRKYVNELQELSTKLKKKRLELTEVGRDDGLARLNLVEPAVVIGKISQVQKPIVILPEVKPAKTSPEVRPMIILPEVKEHVTIIKPAQPEAIKPSVISAPIIAQPLKTAIVAKPIKKTVVNKPENKKVTKKVAHKPLPKKTVDCPPVVSSGFKKTYIKVPATDRNIDVYIDNKKDGNKAVVIKEPVKIITPQVISPK